MVLSHLSGVDLAAAIEKRFPGSVVDCDQSATWVQHRMMTDISEYLKNEPELKFDFLNSISAVDFIEYFEVVYHLTSIVHQHATVVKTKLYGREELAMPSVYHLWRGADFQEREIWDLMGIRFYGHPNMKRILLWEGFEGHPLRKDFL
ncbi:MAG: NADH-quinone oxidoreductase subunit C [Dehalococcoidia bacterium]|nr:NADH-quinone oxidoreductase subunit C [Dehalococcoidia bacterium]